MLLSLFCLDLDLHPDLAVQLLLQLLRTAPDLIAPFGVLRPDDGDVLAGRCGRGSPGSPVPGRGLSPVQKPAVFAPLVLEERGELFVVQGAADHEDRVPDGLRVFHVGRHLEVILPERVSVGTLLRGELRHPDAVAEIVPEFELAVLLSEEGLEHLVVDRVAEFLVARPRLEAVADDAVDPGDRLLFVGDEDPPEARFHAVGPPLVEEDPRRPLSEGAEDLVADRMDLRGDLVGRDPLVRPVRP